MNGEEITGSFYEKELQKTSQGKFRIENVLKKSGKLYVKWKEYVIVLIVGLIEKISYKNESIPFRRFGGNINVKIDLSNYATKTDLKNMTHVDTSSFALKTNVANLKTETDKLDIDKLAPVPAYLSKLSYVVKNDVVKKLCMINWLQK